jgi:hypothetical protein
MSLVTHAAVFALLIVDLFVGGSLVERVGGRWAVTGFEFALILGYVIFVLQAVPWLRRDG